MKEIIAAKKSFNGILVSYLLGNDTNFELFSYENLIEMKINVSDLVANPSHYAFEPNGPAIIRTDFCGKH